MSEVATISAGEFKPAFIVPRYGRDVVGGAEALARALATELARRGIRVTVLTTRALDHHTWRNHYPEGESRVDGVRVLRFGASTRLGEPGFRNLLARLSGGGDLTAGEQEEWLDGVVSSPDLICHIEREGKGYTHLLFLPYLFGTTYFGSALMPERSFIIPCLHDEPYAHQPLILEMLRRARGLLFNSPGEWRLASRLLGAEDPGPVVGMGFREGGGRAADFYNRYPVRGDFILYAGRREAGKNTPMLVEYFRRFSELNPSRASLVLIGSGEVDIPPGISHLAFDPGRVSEKAKWDCYRAAAVFCQPSVNESLSIVLMESWLAGRPAVVHRDCDVTREHIRRSAGGLTFDGFSEFCESLLMLLDDPGLAARLGERGRRYVMEEYNWDSVMGRLYGALGVQAP